MRTAKFYVEKCRMKAALLLIKSERAADRARFVKPEVGRTLLKDTRWKNIFYKKAKEKKWRRKRAFGARVTRRLTEKKYMHEEIRDEKRLGQRKPRCPCRRDDIHKVLVLKTEPRAEAQE